MNEFGVVRRTDTSGRYSIPKELRDFFNIKCGDFMEIFLQGDKIALKTYKPSCILCKNIENTKTYKNRIICEECINELVGKLKV